MNPELEIQRDQMGNNWSQDKLSDPPTSGFNDHRPSLGLAFVKATVFNWKKNYYTDIEYQMTEAGGMRGSRRKENCWGDPRKDSLKSSSFL